MKHWGYLREEFLSMLRTQISCVWRILVVNNEHACIASNDLILQTKTRLISMEAIQKAIPSSELRVLLLAHSFSGSDTTSSIHGFGKA